MQKKNVGTIKRSIIEDLRKFKVSRTASQVDSIINSMSDDDRSKLIEEGDVYLPVEQASRIVKRILIKHGKTPISFFDIKEGKDSLYMTLGTRSGDKYRNKGYASEAARRGIDWMEKHKSQLSQTRLVWGVRTDNIPSMKIAQRNGFNLHPGSDPKHDEWVLYERNI